MQYPPELSLATSSMRNFLVQTVQMEPRSVRTCRPGDRLRLRLPENTLCDLSTLAVRGAVLGIRPNTAGAQCVLPRDSMSLISQVDVHVKHTVVDSIRDYNQVHKLFSDMRDGNHFAKNGVNRHNQNLILASAASCPTVGVRSSTATARGVLATAVPNANTQFWSQGAGGPNQNALPIFFQDWMGFLGQNRWVDTAITGPVDIVLTFASSDVILTNSSGNEAGTSYQLQNLKAYINVAEIDDGVYSNLVSQRLQAGVPINFKRFLTYRPELLTGTGSVQWHANTKSLDAAYCVLLHPNPGRVATQGSNETNFATFLFSDLGEGIWSRRFTFGPNQPADGFVENCYCKLQSQQFPAFRADVDDWYYLAQLTFGQIGNKYGSASAPTQDIDYTAWHSKEAFFSYRWSYSPDLDIESGVNSQGLELYGSFEYEVSPPQDGASQPFGLAPLVIIETTATLLVQADRDIMLIQ